MKTKKLLKSLKRRLGLLTTALAMLLVSQGAFAWGWVVRCTDKQSSENPSCYLGDEITFWWCFNGDGAGASFKRACISTNSSSAGTWNDNVSWQKDGCDGDGNKQYSAKFKPSSSGTWYYSLWLGWGSSVGDNGRYYKGSSTWNEGSSSYQSSKFTVKAVPAPKSCSIEVTNAVSGTGTSSDPYIVRPGASYTVKVTATKADGFTGSGYAFNINTTSSKAGAGTTASYSKDYTAGTAGSSAEYTGYAWHYNGSTSYYSSTYATSSKIYVSVQAACTPTDYYLGGYLNLTDVTTHNDAWKLTQFTPDGGAGAEFAYRGVFYFTSTSGSNNSEFPVILNNCDNIYNPASNDTQLGFNTNGADLSMGNDFGKKCETRNITVKDLYTFVFSKRTSDGKYRITFNYPRIAGTFNSWSPDNTAMSSDGDHMSGDGNYKLRYYQRDIDNGGSISFKITNGAWKGNFGGSDWGLSDYDSNQSILSSGITVDKENNDNNVVLTNNSGQKITATIYFDKNQKIFIKATIPCTPPNKYDVSGPSSVCAGSNAEITLSGSQTGYTYELYKDGVATSTTQAGTGSSLTFSAKVSGSSAVAFTIKGYVTGTPTCNADMNGTVTVTPTALPSAPSGSNINVCSGSDAVFTASQTNNRCIDWYTASTGGTKLATCQTSYTKTNLTSNYKVYVEARNADNGCVSQSRTEITATVNALPTASISGNETVCQNGSLTLTGSGGTQYSWNDGTYSATNTFNVTTSSDGQQTIKLKVKDANNCVSTETSKGVTVNAIPSITSIAAGTGNNECGTGNVTFNSTGATSGATIQWYENSIILSEGTATSYTLEITGGSSKTLKAKAVKDGCESGFTEEATGSRKANLVVSKDLASPTAYEVITLSTNLGAEVTWSKTDANAYFVKDQQAVGGNEVTAETIVLKAPAGSYSITTKKSGECDGNIDITVGTATEVCN